MSERYVIKAKLGEGGAGAVYRAWDAHLNRTVAIKRLLASDGAEETEKMRKDLLREASLLSAIQHPNICQVFEFGVDEDGGFVVMEFVNGEDLEEAARRNVSVDEFCGIAGQTLEGVVAAHSRSILHRDLKPSNVMINWLPNALFQVKVLDFGLAKFSLRPQQQTIDQVSRTTQGSVFFMAPEQFEHKPLDVRTDLYSLGCLFYFLLTNRHPFDGRTMADIMMNHLEHKVTVPLESLRPDLPPKLTQWIGWLMNRQPCDRPESASEALDVLHRVRRSMRTTQPFVAPPSPTPPLPQSPAVMVSVVPVAPPAALTSVPPGARRMTTSRVPVARKSSRAPLAPVPPAAGPVAAAAAPSASRSRSRRGGLTAAVVMGVVLAAGAGIFGVSRCGGKPSAGRPADASNDARAPVPVRPDPPPGGLLVWLDGEAGVRTRDGTQPAVPGGHVDHWNDRATALGGNNAAIYHGITKSQSPSESFPKLRVLQDEGGLHGRHSVLTFNGDKNKLVIGRGKDAATGDPIKGLLPADQLTIFAVARVAKAGVTARLVSAKMGGEINALTLSYGRDEQWHSGIHLAGNIVNHVSLPDPPNAFRVLASWWSKSAGEFRFLMIKPDGSVVRGTPLRNCVHHGPIDEIRLGSHSAGNSDFFAGDVAEVLLYNRALSDADMKSVEDYLVAKYFR